MTGAVIYLGVACFGALGAVARYLVDSVIKARVVGRFPLGILVVNLTGTLALGLLVGVSAPSEVALILGTGFLGGYTTFSTWMVDSERLGEARETVQLAVNLAGSMLLGLGVAALGYQLGLLVT